MDAHVCLPSPLSTSAGETSRTASKHKVASPAKTTVNNRLETFLADWLLLTCSHQQVPLSSVWGQWSSTVISQLEHPDGLARLVDTP